MNIPDFPLLSQAAWHFPFRPQYHSQSCVIDDPRPSHMSRQECTQTILQLVLPSIEAHREQGSCLGAKRPFVLGLTGLQGCGKSTLASNLVEALHSTYSFRAVEVCLDYFYKTHAERQALSAAHPENRLLRVRGQPGTLDTTRLLRLGSSTRPLKRGCTGKAVKSPCQSSTRAFLQAPEIDFPRQSGGSLTVS
jgi:pantothenate kinase